MTEDEEEEEREGDFDSFCMSMSTDIISQAMKAKEEVEMKGEEVQEYEGDSLKQVASSLVDSVMQDVLKVHHTDRGQTLCMCCVCAFVFCVTLCVCCV